MRLRFKILVVFCVVVGMMAATFVTINAASTAEVTGSSGTYTAKVNGSTVYTGTRYFDAINAACNKAGEGAIILIKTSGTSGNDNGSIYAVKPLKGQTLDFNGSQIDCNSSGDFAVGVYADRKDNITIKNLKMKGDPRYGIWIRGSSNVTLSNISMSMSNSNPVGLGIRVDNSTQSASNLKINGSILVQGTNGHAIETYGLNGVSIGDVTVNNTGGCGLLLNESVNCVVGTVKGDKNCQAVSNGGYATFRIANGNGKTTVKKVYSRNSGRGFFSVSGSKDCTIDLVDIAGSTLQGIFVENSSNIYVKSGTVSSGKPNVQHVNASTTKTYVNGKNYTSTNGIW